MKERDLFVFCPMHNKYRRALKCIDCENFIPPSSLRIVMGVQSSIKCKFSKKSKW